ncbi:hydrolase 1, exosortase A system-associated [Hydrogenophaga sp.]|uniref:hydrolase 1, exosortase A system-associated n=1 Tax=Hydrogenophaga sp. TaxID=1904254 RepID=UPI003564D001
MTHAALNVLDAVVKIPCADQDMLGILSLPPPGVQRKNVALVIVVGGAQYRAGSHRQFVLLARRLATAGYPVLRFDMRGMGDTPGQACDFENTQADITAALDVLPSLAPGIEKVVLWGLCDGASASLLYLQATQDPRVAGLCLLNPWLRSEASLARTQVRHYYGRRLLEAAFWRKLWRGGVGWQALAGLGRNLRTAFTARSTQPHPALSYQERMAMGWRSFGGAILLLLSERDLTAQEFLGQAQQDALWVGSLKKPGVSQHLLSNADHTLSATTSRLQMEELTLQWLDEIAA